ncbi:MAG: tRNA (adenosine(37)-N6)-threonylcarbamoyltransferase complex transferase subunit TsaD [Bacteroidetes bacterium]|nr:tRNA (adenosine(37)-N6)-threonylcarbamoyltransferase complex transferase subunit TsaD [Bacteroidota bacterium]
MSKASVLLGIETSCDDTAAAVLIDGSLMSNVVSSQPQHIEFGGVVPEVASRAHEKLLVSVVDDALKQAGIGKNELTGIAVTKGPGLIGSLMVGVSFAKAAALGLGVPFIGVNHLEGHLASLFLSNPPPPFPHLCLIVSGGHTQLMQIDAPGQFKVLGKTRDDAAGEAFDKVGKILGLDYPAGPQIDRLAIAGNRSFHPFPRTRLKGYDYSFSGIKTSVLYYLNSFDEMHREELIRNSLADICASFQEAVVDMLISPIKKAIKDTGIRHVGLVGGVSANLRLRTKMLELLKQNKGQLYVPEMAYCMDNAAMIAMAGYFRLKNGEQSDLSEIANPSLKLL